MGSKRSTAHSVIICGHGRPVLKNEMSWKEVVISKANHEGRKK